MKIIDGYELAANIKKAADKKRDSGLYILAGMVTGFVNDMQEAEAYTEAKKHIENLQKVNEDLEERIAIMSEGGWVPVGKRLPENAEHKGAYCPRYRVLTKWGETIGWYNPDQGCWYFILWYLDGECIDFEHGDHPEVAKERNGVSLVTHWMPMSELPKGGE